MFTKKHIGLDLLRGVILIFILITACTTSPVETNVAPSVPSPTIAPSATSASTNTPTEVPTFTPVPTATSTPQPEWVTTLAQPILDAIADRPPEFQDDFNDYSRDWIFKRWCNKGIIQDGEMFLSANCEVYQPNINYPDFVLEVDSRFLPDSDNESYWYISFRDLGGPNHGITIHNNGTVNIGMEGGEDKRFEGAAYPAPQTNHILIIAKRWEFAFFVNGQPLHYVENNKIRSGNNSIIRVYISESFSSQATVAFDNFKIWNISNLP